MEDEIKRLLSEATGNSFHDISDYDMLLDGGLMIDSIVLLNLIVDIETMYGITFEDEEISTEHFNCLADISSLIREKVDDNDTEISAKA